MKILFTLLITMFALSGFSQTDLRLTSLKRKFKDNSEWILATNKGIATLKNVYTDGHEWQLTLPDKAGTYTIKQTFNGDPKEWHIYNSKEEMFFTLSFSNDFNEWRTGDEGKWVYLKTVFKNDFKEWKADANEGTCTIKTVFSDGSEWKITDNLKGESTITRLSISFIPLATYLFGRGK